jgi:hypothetical protein
MSGQPCIHPSDADKFRKAYLDTLAVQVANNDANYQANKLHQRTGQVATQITDYRSTPEKFADMTSLRVLVKAELRRLMDDNNVERSMNHMTDDQVQLVSQSIEAIVKELVPRYKQGVDSAVFLDYIRALEKKPLLTTPASAPVSRSSSLPAVLDVKLIDEDELRGQMDATMRLGQLMRRIGTDLADDVGEALQYQMGKIDHILGLLPEVDALSVALKDSAVSLLNASMINYPNTDQLTKMIRTLQITNDREYIADALRRILQEVSPLENEREMIARAEAIIEHSDYAKQNELLATIGEEETGYLRSEVAEARSETSDAYRMVSDYRRQIADFQAVIADLQGQLAEATTGAEATKIQRQLETAQRRLEETERVLAETSSRLTEATKSLPEPDPDLRAKAGTAGGKGQKLRQIEILKAYMNAGLALMNKSVRNAFRTGKDGRLRLNSEGSADAMDAEQVALLYEENYDAMVAFNEQVRRPVGLPRSRSVSASSSGSAYGSPRTSPRENPDVLAFLERVKGKDTGLGQEPPSRLPEGRGLRGKGLSVAQDKGIAFKKVAPFGRYMIHLSKLNEDVICLSTQQGTNVPSYRTLRVSVPVANIIRKMVNGRNPSYEDIQKLDEQDKAEIHKVFKKAQITMGEGLEIPKPVSQIEDMNRFTILKGEILAGNDGRETIKQFKLLTLKLMNSGHLPKGQAKDLLVDLANLGY